MVKTFYKYFFVAVIFCAGTLTAQNIEVYAYTDSTQYVIGDYINYHIELTYDKNISVEMPPIKDSLSVLDFIEELPVNKNEDETEIYELHSYIFSKYDSAQVTIPGQEIIYSVAGSDEKNAILTNSVSLTVETIKIDPAADINDVKAPIRIPLPWLWIILFSLLGLLIIAGLIYLYLYYKRKREQVDPKKLILKVPPHKTALSSLYELEDKKLWQQGLIKEYHTEITGIIRKYFENRFNFLALEMPSSEMLDYLKGVKKFDKVFDLSTRFFDNADMVKFAKFKPIPTVNEEMMKQAYEIVHRTKPVEEVAETTVEEEKVG